jgi:NADH-quinone oxidoreductase subunit J
MYIVQWILGAILILSSLGVILAPKPVHSALSFLLSLLTLATIYLQLSAQFIAIMQILVYAGAILVIFMFVIVLFQDAHQQISKYEPQSIRPFLIASAIAFVIAFIFLATQLTGISTNKQLPGNFGTVQALGKALYLDYFFPFEAVTLLFLVAIVGALYIAKKPSKITTETQRHREIHRDGG